jgi:hypothetical protein
LPVPASTMEMLRPRCEASSLCDAMGLGWMLGRLSGTEVIKHGGSTAGQEARVTLVPGADRALVVLANSHEGHALDTLLSTRVLLGPCSIQPRWARFSADVSDDLLREAGRRVRELAAPLSGSPG